MTTVERKQQERLAYIESVQEHIKILASETMAQVPSSDDQHKYIVTIEDGKATDCGCDGCYRNGAKVPGYCRHREALDTYIARQIEAQQAVEVANEIVTSTPKVEEQHIHIICGGCGCICGEGKGDRCHLGFCFWNSFWTERKRLEEDERMKLVYELKAIAVHNRRVA